MIQSTGFNWDDIVEDAVDRAGGGAATGADVLSLGRSLRILLERWQARGYPTWRLKTKEVWASGTTAYVPLPDDVDDIVAVNSVIQSTEQSEAAMRRISADQYHAITRKTTAGRPSQWFLDRTTKPRLYVFPIGNTTQPVALNIMYVERPAAFAAYQTNDDVPGRWLEALILGLAHDLSRKRPAQGGVYNEALIQRLKMEALEAEQTAQNADRHRNPYRIRMG